MRKIAFWLSLAYIFAIPGEVLLEYPALGSGAKVIGIALAVFWVGNVLISARFPKPRFFHLALLLFALWNVVSIFWTTDTSRTLEHIGTWFQLFLMVVVLLDLYTTRADILAGLQAYVLGCYIIIGSTILNYVSNNPFYWERFSATGTNPDDLGIILALAIPAAFYLGTAKDKFAIPLLHRVVNYAFPAAAIFGIALSGTRTALIAAIPGLLLGLITFARVRAWSRIALVLLLVAAILYVVPLIPKPSIDRLSTTMTEFTRGDLNGRLSLWNQGLMAFTQHPFLGVGSNMYRSTNIEGKVAHNSFLSVLVELGIVGFLLFALILITVFVHAISQPRWDAIFWIFTLGSWAIGASTLTWEYQKATWLVFSLIVGAAGLTRARAVIKTANQPEGIPGVGHGAAQPEYGQ